MKAFPSPLLFLPFYAQESTKLELKHENAHRQIVSSSYNCYKSLVVVTIVTFREFSQSQGLQALSAQTTMKRRQSSKK